jgi:integrase
MKDLKNKHQLLSLDLSGYESYLENLGMTDRNISFLVLAPRKLIELFGCLSGLELLKDAAYRSKFLDFIRDLYEPGQLKKYSAGITHYREYLISIAALIPYSTKKVSFPRKIKEGPLDHYHVGATPYFRKIEKEYWAYLNIELEQCKQDNRKKMRAYKKFAIFLQNTDFTTFGKVGPQQILDFKKLKTTLKTDWEVLKCVLTYLFQKKHTVSNLTPAVIKIKPRKSFNKQYLKSSEVERLLEAIDTSNVVGKRDFAIIMLMARLGLRPCEPVRMQLSDIDWQNARLLVRGKNNKNEWLPMPQDVGEAIFNYLKVAPRGDTQNLFVRLRPPYDGYNTCSSQLITLRNAYVDAGIRPPTGRARLNVFRHSLATNLLNSNKSVFEVQALLRHSNPSMTLHYAKYHAKKLSLFEIKWPGGSK